MTGGYFDAMREADEALDDALAAIRDEEAEGRITPVEPLANAANCCNATSMNAAACAVST